MAEYDLADLFEDVTLKIGENRYKLRERTHSLAEKVTPIEAKFEATTEDAGDQEMADLLIDLIDALLEPLGDESGTRKHAKTVLARSYKNDEIGLDRLMAISGFLQEKFTDRSRPTSAAPISA